MPASYPYLELSWTAVKWILTSLGGFAGVTKIFEWIFSGPKITGSVEHTVSGSGTVKEESGAMLFLLIYLVNKRVNPTTVRAFFVSAKVHNRWVLGRNIHIPDGFRLPNVSIDFPSARLYEIAGLNLLEYGKGVRGWLYIFFPGLEREDVREAKLKIELIDAFEKKHIIYDEHKALTKGISFYPGAGIKIT